MKRSVSTPNLDKLPEVSFSDDGEVRYLHLGTPWVQGSMRLDKPFDIDLDYVQRMMAWLLWFEMDSVASRHALQLGLGAGAITKFCRKRLGMRTTVVEINPGVIAACHGYFKLPRADSGLTVVQGDAGQVIQTEDWQGTVDALQIDLYDQDAAAPVLDSEAFYADCRRLLTPDGVLTVNLFGRNASYAATLAKIRRVFGVEGSLSAEVAKLGAADAGVDAKAEAVRKRVPAKTTFTSNNEVTNVHLTGGMPAGQVLAFPPTKEGNTIVIATNQPDRLAPDVQQDRAQAVQSRTKLPATKWLKLLKT